MIRLKLKVWIVTVSLSQTESGIANDIPVEVLWMFWFICLQVIYKPACDDWYMIGGSEPEKIIEEDDGKTYYYQKW